jgi:hypothetical protein
MLACSRWAWHRGAATASQCNSFEHRESRDRFRVKSSRKAPNTRPLLHDYAYTDPGEPIIAGQSRLMTRCPDQGSLRLAGARCRQSGSAYCSAGTLARFKARERERYFHHDVRFFHRGARLCSRIETKIVLIDGEQLAQMLIDHNIGVSPVASYEIKRVDSDDFTGQ